MISSITSVLTGIEQPDGYTIANAQGFTDNDDNGSIIAKFGQEEYYDEDTGDWLYTGSNDAYYAVYLTAGVTYALTSTYNSFNSWEGPYIRFEDAGGSQVGTAITVEDLDEDPWIRVVPGSFTPSTTGVYYLHAYCDSYAMSQYSVPLNISPRPGEYSRIIRRLWDAIQGQTNSNGVLVEKSSCIADIPAPVVYIPLENNTQAQVSTADTGIEGGDQFVFNGEYAYCSANNLDFKVYVPNVLLHGFTVGLHFNPNADAGWLIGVDNVNLNALFRFENNNTADGFFLYRHKEPFHGVALYAPHDMARLLAWHHILISFDFTDGTLRGVLDGRIFGMWQYPQSDLRKFGDYKTSMYENIYRTDNFVSLSGARGKFKHLRVWNTALDFERMITVNSRYN